MDVVPDTEGRSRMHETLPGRRGDAMLRRGRVHVKTAAAQALDKIGATYQVLEYHEDALTAQEAAEKLGLPLERVFKTLVVRGDRGGVVLACLPGSSELDLKQLARVSANKRVDLVPVADIHRLTGYLRGGVSPLGSRRQYPVFLDETADRHATISVSAGMRGMQLLVRPVDLARASGATIAPIAI
jgi:Cys-tRNA(Pro)/Cys-tRNA(Cys) deacylase